MLFSKASALKDLYKLTKRVDKFIPKKVANKIEKSPKAQKKVLDIIDYTVKKPKSAKRRIKRINKALDVAPYAAVASAAFGTGAVISSGKKNKKKS